MMTSELLVLDAGGDPSERSHRAACLSQAPNRDGAAPVSPGVRRHLTALAEPVHEPPWITIEPGGHLEQARKVLRAAEVRHRASLALGGEQRLAGRVERLLDAAIELLGVRDASVALLDSTGAAFEIVAARGRAATVGDASPVDAGLIGSVARAGHPVRIEDITYDARVCDADVGIGPDTRSWLAVPLISSAGAFGVLIVTSHLPDAFDPSDERGLSELADLAGGPLHDAHKLDIAHRVVDELETSRLRYRDVAEASADWFWEQDDRLRFTWISQGAGGPSERRVQSHLGKTWRETRPFGMTDDAWERHEADVRARRPFRDFLLTHRGADGRLQVVSVSGKPVFDERRNFHGYRGSAVDVTARRQPEALAVGAERALAETARPEAMLRARARQQAVLNDLSRMAIARGRLKDLFEAVSAGVASAFDADLAHVSRLRDRETLLLEAGHGWPDGLVGAATLEAGDGTPGGQVLAIGEPLVADDLTGADWSSQTALLRHQGVVSGVLMAIRTATVPYGVLGVHLRRRVTFSQGDLHFVRAVANMLALAIDLARSRKAVSALLDTTADLVVRIGPDLGLRDPNAAFALARVLSPDERGARMGDQPGPPTSCGLERWQDVAQAVFQSGRERFAGLPLSTAHGERHYEVRFVPELGVDAQVESVLVIARDVTAWRRTEDECAALRRELNERDRQHQSLVSRLLVEHDEVREHERLQRDAALIAEQLTAREVEILRLVIEGKTNRQIARCLHLSAGTVRNHLGRIFPKLDAVDRTQAAVRAVELRLVDMDAP
jgi:DNA-binding CsgD family transcriptional regulator/GAF domain-containing protein